VSLDFGPQAYKRFDVTFGQFIVQFFYKIGFLSVREGVPVAWGLRAENWATRVFRNSVWDLKKDTECKKWMGILGTCTLSTPEVTRHWLCT